MERGLIILDLDETLIYATKQKLDRTFDFKVFDYLVYKRPYLEEFLTQLSVHYKIAIWSSAGDDYVQTIAKLIIPKGIKLEFIWSRKQAIRRKVFENKDEIDWDNHNEYVKPLKKVKRKGYILERMLIVDDSPHKSKLNYGNAIYPNPYNGEATDKELISLFEYLESIKDEPNFRNIEKRNWKVKYDH